MHKITAPAPLAAALILLGCAAHRPEPSPGAVTPRAAAKPAPVAAAPVRSASANPPADKNAGVDLALVKRGYRARQREGQVKYCRTQVLTGTHFSNTICYTAEQIRAQEATTKSDLDTINQQRNAPCPNNKCD